MSIMDDIFGSDSSWPTLIKTGLDIGGNLYDSYNKSSTSNDYINSLRASEDRQFADTNAYNSALAAWQQQQAGAAASARAASAAAAGATDKNRQAAAKKAQAYLDKVYKRTMDMYAPFKDTATRLLPQMEKSYSTGIDTSNMLSAYLQNPQNMALLNGSTSAAASGPMLPDYLRRG